MSAFFNISLIYFPVTPFSADMQLNWV